MRRKIAAAVLAWVGAVVLLATPAYAVTANISPTSGPPGTVIRISGSGCPGATQVVRVTLTNRQRNAIGHEINVAGSQTWSTTITVPSTFPAGPYFVDVDCRGGPARTLLDDAVFGFTVTSNPPSGTCAALQESQAALNDRFESLIASLRARGVSTDFTERALAIANAQFDRVIVTYCEQ